MLDLPTKDDSVKYFIQLFKKYKISNRTDFKAQKTFRGFLYHMFLNVMNKWSNNNGDKISHYVETTGRS